MTDFNRDTGGTSQRRGVHGDPWRQPPPPDPDLLGNLSAGRGIPAWERAIFIWALCIFIGAIAAGIVAAQY